MRNHEDTNSTKEHESRFVKSRASCVFVFFVTSWFLS
jgi:hypothetical protein